MPRLSTPETVSPKSQRLLDATQKSLGFVPNMLRAMAAAPAVLSGFTGLSAALSDGTLSTELREKIGLAIAEENACEYCVSAHTAIAGGAGLSVESILDARRGHAVERQHQAALDFARAVHKVSGRVGDDDIARVRAAGFSDGEIGEIVSNVVFSLYTNYFNNVAQADIDFPQVPLLDAHASKSVAAGAVCGS